MAKPGRVLRWASVSGRVEPTAAEKDDGLAEGDGLPDGYLNDSFGLTGDWTDWLDERLFDGYTVPTDHSDCRLYGDPDTGLTVQASNGNKLPVVCADPDETAAQMVPTVNWHDKHVCAARRAATQTITSSEAIEWTAILQDVSGMIDTGSVGEDVITIPVAGSVWMIAVTAVWATGTAGSTRAIRLFKNASVTPVTGMESYCGVVAAVSPTCSIMGIVGGDGDPLVAGDTFKVYAVETETGTADLLAARLSMIRIS